MPGLGIKNMTIVVPNKKERLKLNSMIGKIVILKYEKSCGEDSECLEIWKFPFED